jgi:hypothetical protein
MGPKIKWGGGGVALAVVVAAVLAANGGGPPNNPVPPAGGFPTAATTGVPLGVTLTQPTLDSEGNLKILQANEIVTGVDVHGCILVRAEGVVVRDSKMRCISTDSEEARTGAKLLLEDSTVDCDPAGQVADSRITGGTGMQYENYIARRVDFTRCENGLDMYRNDTLEDSFIHDLTQCATPDCSEPNSPHTDGIQSADDSGVTIRHNTIEAWNRPCPPNSTTSCSATSAINLNNNPGFPGTINDVLVENNLLSGGAYTLYCPRIPSSRVNNFVIKDNHFSTEYRDSVGAFGPSSDCSPAGGEIQSGNVYHETGQPIVLP